MRVETKEELKRIAQREESSLRKLKRNTKIVMLLFFFLLIAGLIMFSIHLLELSGYAGFVNASAGSVSELQVHVTKPVYIWSGVYGLALRVPDFTETISSDLDSGTIDRVDIFFDCLESINGRSLIFATNFSGLDLESSTISAGTTQMVDSFLDCSFNDYCASNTFTKYRNVTIGPNEILNVPSTYTYKADGSNEVFEIGLLNVSNKLVFVSYANSTIQRGFNPDVIVNFQMLLPVPTNSTQKYYYYASPYDECPAGGIGSSINSTISGYLFAQNGSTISNTIVSFAGTSVSTDSNGFYNISSLVLEGTYSLIYQKSGYKTGVNNVTVSFSEYVFNKNITLENELTQTVNTVNPIVFGYVTNNAGLALESVNVSLGANSTQTDSNGYYSLNPTLVSGVNIIVAIKSSYDNYYEYLTLNLSSTYNHNITLSVANLEDFPFVDPKTDDNPGDSFDTAKSDAEETGQDFWISPKEIIKQVRYNTFIEDKIDIYNFKSSEIRVNFEASPELNEILVLEQSSLVVGSESENAVEFSVYGTKPVGIYRGTLTLTGDIEAEIPVRIEIMPDKFNLESLIMELELFSNRVTRGSQLRYKLSLQNLLSVQSYKIDLKNLVTDLTDTRVYLTNEEDVEISDSLALIRDVELPENLTEGVYNLKSEATYQGLFSTAVASFTIYRPFYAYTLFGIPIWIIFVVVSVLSFGILNFLLYKEHMEKKKRYRIAMDFNTLPKPGERSIKLGKIAETNVPAYYDLDMMTVHSIVAGATGGGKSIAAQVFIEEALMKNIAVIVFDPTAQWSGMLRKCEDKKMISLYPKFGLKPSDAKGFPGNVREVFNEREMINIEKYVKPGQIQIFTLNKLDPSKMDIFVAGVIASIFNSDPKEYPGLRVLLVFDEVHRLLPKFGGSGKGFLQIERAAREFRKWGYGVMLVSQVLSDFVGEIKANINTEVLMRAAEENDLERIRSRYGMDALKSLVKSEVGTGMIQNAEYNRGKPYFVNFRPILHNTRRLSDEVLEKYNGYNDVIDDIDYQIEQLETEKVDTFDLKMELKLVKDKLMTGNFSVVDIYLEGLKPRVDKQWSNLGKQPKKREIKLIDDKVIESSAAAIKKDLEKEEKAEKKEEKK